MASTVSNGNDRSEKWHRPFQMATTVYEREICIATGVPHPELAALIASIVDERMNRQLIQDGGASNAQLPRPSPPSNLQDSLRSSPPPPPQDGGQNMTHQQPPSLQNPPTGNLLPNTTVSSGLAASSGLGSLSSPVDFSDPAQGRGRTNAFGVYIGHKICHRVPATSATFWSRTAITMSEGPKDQKSRCPASKQVISCQMALK